MNKLKIIVIGNGMVGYKFCEKLTSKSDAFKITVFGEEPRRAYDRVHLSEYFNGKTADDLSMSTETWYQEQDIDLYLNNQIVGVDRNLKTVRTSSKGEFAVEPFCRTDISRYFVYDVGGYRAKVQLDL